MEIIWSNEALKDLSNFKSFSLISSDEKLNSYVSSLVDFIDSLLFSAKLGKLLFVSNNIEFRQLIFKMHRIIYSLTDNHIYILAIIHTHRDTRQMLNYIKSNFSYLN